MQHGMEGAYSERASPRASTSHACSLSTSGGGRRGEKSEFEAVRQEHRANGKEKRIRGKWRKEMCSCSCHSVRLPLVRPDLGSSLCFVSLRSHGAASLPWTLRRHCPNRAGVPLFAGNLEGERGGEVELDLARSEADPLCLLALLPPLPQAGVARGRAAAEPLQSTK